MLIHKSFSLAILVFLFCNFCSAQTTNSTPPPDWKNYIIRESEALAMIDYYTSCTGTCEKRKLDKNRDRKRTVKTVLKQDGKAKGEDYKLDGDYINARYRSADVARYQKINCTGESVEGVATKILRMRIIKDDPVNKGKKIEEYQYFDVSSVCPPPTPCRRGFLGIF